MANFYYVSDGATVGTAAAATDNGRVATTRSTGSYAAKGAANIYPDIETALAAATAPVAGDYIMCASDHAHTYTVSTTLTIPTGVIVISCDVSNCDQYLAGAEEDCSATNVDLTIVAPSDLNGEIYFHGMTLLSGDDLILQGIGGRHHYQDCTLGAALAGSGSAIVMTHDGLRVIMDSCKIKFGHASNNINLTSGGHLHMRNCSHAAVTTGVTTLFVFATGGNGGRNVHIDSCDFSSVIATNGDLFDTFVAASDNLTATVNRTLMPTGWGVWGTAPTLNHNYKIDITETGVTDEYYRFLYIDQDIGQAELDTTTYLNATYDGTTGFSVQVTTGADATPHNPYRVKIGTIPAQDLSTDQTITVECTSDASLTDNDIWIEIGHNNNTNEAAVDIITTQNADPLAAGDALSTPADPGWNNPDTETYQITQALGAQSLVDNGNVDVYACVGLASIVANFDLPTIAAT